MPPPKGMRIVLGSLTLPADRQCICATWLTIWSNAGKTNPSNWISQTGRKPRMARPTAVPTIPDSASGVSMTRSSPKSFCSPSVTRKTPPSLPTSSPMMRTFGSSSSARRKPSLIAFANVSDAMSALRSRIGEDEGIEVRRGFRALLVDQRMLLRVHLIEQFQRLRIGHVQATLAQPGGQRVGLRLQFLEVRRVDELLFVQERLHPLQRVLELPRLQVTGQPVARGVIGG